MISFNDKIFYLKSNSSNGTSSTDTIFHYKQNKDVVTANFTGGNVLCGNIIAIHKGDYLDMIYQMLTTNNELKSGKAIANVFITETNKIQLNLNWEWLIPGNIKGTSTYCEE